jgi:hypothetical protein
MSAKKFKQNKEKSSDMSAIIRTEGVNSRGYGIIPKFAMTDTDLPITAKAIYAFFCICTSGQGQAHISRDYILHILQINKDTYYKHRKLLIDSDYLKVKQIYDEKHIFSKAIYTISNNPKKLQTYITEKDNKQSDKPMVRFSQTIQKYGYGMLPRTVFLDKRLSVKAKALYAYFCSFAGAGDYVCPSRSVIRHHLKISNASYQKYMNELIATNYISLFQRIANGRFQVHDIYINAYPNSSEAQKYRTFILENSKKPDTEKTCANFSDTENLMKNNQNVEKSVDNSSNVEKSVDNLFIVQKPCTNFSDTEKPDTEKPDTEKPDINTINRIPINSSSNNSIAINSEKSNPHHMQTVENKTEGSSLQRKSSQFKVSRTGAEQDHSQLRLSPDIAGEKISASMPSAFSDKEDLTIQKQIYDFHGIPKVLAKPENYKWLEKAIHALCNWEQFVEEGNGFSNSDTQRFYEKLVSVIIDAASFKSFDSKNSKKFIIPPETMIDCLNRFITFDEERHIAYFEIIDKLVDDCLQKAHNQFVEKKTLLTDKELLAFVTAWFQKPFKGGVFQ